MIGFLRHATGFAGGVRLDGDGVYLRHPRDADWAEWAELRAESRDFTLDIVNVFVDVRIFCRQIEIGKKVSNEFAQLRPIEISFVFD